MNANEPKFCDVEWPFADDVYNPHYCTLPTKHDGDHLCCCGSRREREQVAS